MKIHLYIIKLKNHAIVNKILIQSLSKKITKMEEDMKVTFKTVKKMVMEFSTIKMEAITKECGEITKWMDKENFIMIMENLPMKDNGI